MIIDFKNFETKTFLEATAPVFEEENGIFKVKSKENAYFSAGMFYSTVDAKDFADKRICAEVKVNCSTKKSLSMALILFYDEDGKKIQSDYFTKGEEKYTFEGEMPNGAKTCEIELLAFFYGDGCVDFSELKVELLEKKAHRVAKIATAYIECKGTPESNMQEVYDILDKAGPAKEKPDLICFTEGVHCLRANARLFLNDESEEMKKVCAKAKQYGYYVLFTSLEEDERGHQYNTAFVISPDGEIVDRYRKTHLTLSELKVGLVPGDEIRVFETPFCRFGILICWDQWFTQASKEIEKQGAEVLFWLTRGYHEERLVTRARDTGMYVITSNPTPEKSCIAHPTTGEIIARGSGVSGYVMAEIDFDGRPVSEYKSFGVNGGNDKDIFINELRNDLYTH